MRKTETAVQRCKTMSTLQKILGGKWKLEILYYIAFCDIRRFGALRRQLGEITESSLTKQLRELEADGFLLRHQLYGCTQLYEKMGRAQLIKGGNRYASL